MDNLHSSNHVSRSRKRSGVRPMPHLNAVQALMQGPMPLAQLVCLENLTDGIAFVETLRQFGLELPIYTVPAFDANYDVDMVEVCVLTTADIRRVNRALKKIGGEYA
ncbi:hypothetical protein LP420_04215 [Massilia sp. B-10]|nr:hypothetical protein LP420_04215 [Massilia sp. B-10]UUZ55062.1 hypothetical protein LP419_03975 [Massilia sp. H-1]